MTWIAEYWPEALETAIRAAAARAVHGLDESLMLEAMLAILARTVARSGGSVDETDRASVLRTMSAARVRNRRTETGRSEARIVFGESADRAMGNVPAPDPSGPELRGDVLASLSRADRTALLEYAARADLDDVPRQVVNAARNYREAREVIDA